MYRYIFHLSKIKDFLCVVVLWGRNQQKKLNLRSTVLFTFAIIWFQNYKNEVIKCVTFYRYFIYIIQPDISPDRGRYFYFPGVVELFVFIKKHQMVVCMSDADVISRGDMEKRTVTNKNTILPQIITPNQTRLGEVAGILW